MEDAIPRPFTEYIIHINNEGNKLELEGKSYQPSLTMATIVSSFDVSKTYPINIRVSIYFVVEAARDWSWSALLRSDEPQNDRL